MACFFFCSFRCVLDKCVCVFFFRCFFFGIQASIYIGDGGLWVNFQKKNASDVRLKMSYVVLYWQPLCQMSYRKWEDLEHLLGFACKYPIFTFRMMSAKVSNNNKKQLQDPHFRHPIVEPQGSLEDVRRQSDGRP